MTAYFVSRHRGAIEWFQRQGRAAQVVPHLDAVDVRPGDVVMGTLPIQLVAAITANGARYLHLEIDLTAGKRGTELTADEMERLGARLVEYEARRVHAEASGAGGRTGD